MPRLGCILFLLLSLLMCRVPALARQQPIAGNSDLTKSNDHPQADKQEQEDVRPEQPDGLWAVLVGKDSARMLKGEKIRLSDTKINTNSFSGVAQSHLVAPMLQSGANQYAFNLSLRSHSFINQTLVGAADNNAMGLIAMLTRHKITSTYVWAVRGSTASAIVPDNPTLEVHYDDIPGVNPIEFRPVIVRLTATPNNLRKVGETRVKIDASGQSATAAQFSSFVEDRVAAQVTVLGKGDARISVPHLPAGEYALALRSISERMKIAVSDIGSDHGNWLVLGQVWAFTVK